MMDCSKIAAIVNGVPVAIAPPEGYVVDFDHPQQNSLIQAYWLFSVGNFLTFLFMSQRVYVKLIIQRRVQIEDGKMLTLGIRRLPSGIMGVHGWEMPLSKFMLFMQSLVIFIVVGSSVAIMFATIFACQPVAAAWDLTITEFTCINRVALHEATAIIGAVTDLLVLAVPVSIVVTLQITTWLKIGLIGFFIIGAITSFTSIMRLVALINSLDNEDKSWGAGVVLLWIFAESNLAIICGPTTTIKPYVAPRLLGSSANTSKYGAGGNTAKMGNSSHALRTFGGTGGGSETSTLV
ncbi:hypothetical protein B0T26DRAFT_742013 [Lasiosphaeria miniovina]|uniref:Rhodopsin domain-containing protein n=1 Tax=Lasiosphaeria miniovina TaxID=1954250 RepID=A0AA40AC69_9PEZI|nr:uncharacterized protein B0T26DRAFT_742013 [Lasiosphaeria miniovina]KAK0713191.1 hypothetical protein B0T26DRAFT_742013 [Lasiosphaeria miniovina]